MKWAETNVNNNGTELNKRKNRLRALLTEIYKHRVAYFLVAPFAAVFITFTIIPVLMSIGLSFTYFNMLEAPKFIGFENYRNLFLVDDIFLTSVRNTFVLAIVTGPIGYMAALLCAWFINELPPKIRAFMVLVFYAPSISGSVYLIWGVVFSGDAYGYLNGFLLDFGLINEPSKWLSDPAYMMSSIIVVVLWMSLGAGFLAFIAGLQGVDKTMYEAGYVDGIRNRWQELWYITLPAMRPQLMFGAIMSVTTSFAIADQTAQLCGLPSTDYAVHTVVNHLQDYGQQRFEMGYASAIATILFIIMILSNKGIQNLLKKVGR